MLCSMAIGAMVQRVTEFSTSKQHTLRLDLGVQSYRRYIELNPNRASHHTSRFQLNGVFCLEVVYIQTPRPPRSTRSERGAGGAVRDVRVVERGVKTNQ